jgi:hypothetical protein
MPFPSYPPCFLHLSNIWWRVQVMKFLITYFSKYLKVLYSNCSLKPVHVSGTVRWLVSRSPVACY